MNRYHAQLPDIHRIYGRTSDDCGECPAGLEDIPEPLRRGAVVPNACYAGERPRPLGHLRSCKPISAYHRRKHRRLSFDRCARCNEVPFRQRSIEGLRLGSKGSRMVSSGHFKPGELRFENCRDELVVENVSRRDIYQALTLGRSNPNRFYFWAESSAYLRQ
jgi:hypothetical protein